MKGRVECTFTGGPAGDEKLFLPAVQCLDKLSLEQAGWLRVREDGKFDVMAGMRPTNADWESYSLAVYTKVPCKASGVTYQFDELKAVYRCKGIAATTGRRCRHDAVGDTKYCRQHAPAKEYRN